MKSSRTGMVVLSLTYLPALSFVWPLKTSKPDQINLESCIRGMINKVTDLVNKVVLA